MQETAKWDSPSWQLIGDLAIDQLKQGHTDYAISMIPVMVEKLMALDKYTDKDGKLSIAWKFGKFHIQSSEKLNLKPTKGK